MTDDFQQLNEKFIKARRDYEALLESSMAQPQQSHYGRPGQQPYGYGGGGGGPPQAFPPRNFYSPQPGKLVSTVLLSRSPLTPGCRYAAIQRPNALPVLPSPCSATVTTSLSHQFTATTIPNSLRSKDITTPIWSTTRRLPSLCTFSPTCASSSNSI